MSLFNPLEECTNENCVLPDQDINIDEINRLTANAQQQMPDDRAIYSSSLIYMQDFENESTDDRKKVKIALRQPDPVYFEISENL